MFGSVRLLLAIIVALSHVGIVIWGFNPGPVAVIQFYLISGFVTAALLDSQFVFAADYYKERALRLLPGYWAVLVIAAVIWIVVQPVGISFLQRSPGWADWVSNISLIPLNFFMWSGQDQFMLVPPAWSLATEFQFYALAPLILRMRPSARSAAILGSFAVWLVSVTGSIHTDWWGYRLLPGVLFVFMLGASIRRAEWRTAQATWVGTALVFAALMVHWTVMQPFNVETSLGVVIGAPLIVLMSRVPRRGWDDKVGRLAYPMFLLHFPVMWAFDGLGYSPASVADKPLVLLSWLGCTLIASGLLFMATELPLMRLRHSLRRSSAAASAKTGCFSWNWVLRGTRASSSTLIAVDPSAPAAFGKAFSLDPAPIEKAR
jgi:peptidoglycan/LPS O-acetylase OafA/YrhL